MKSITKDEIEALDIVLEDVNLTIKNTFSNFLDTSIINIYSLAPIYIGLYFKSLNHDNKNPNWKNRDFVFSTNNYAKITENIVRVHNGYYDFEKLEEYLEKNTFLTSENTFGDAIGHYVVDRESDNNHERYYYIIVSDIDLLNNITALEYIQKNNMRRIIIIVYTREDKININKENKLNGKLINMGFDTLIISRKVENVCDAIIYAKRLEKPTIILAST